MKNLLFISFLIFLLAGCNKTVTDIYTIKNNSTQYVSMQDIRDADKTTISNLKPGGIEHLSFKHPAKDGLQIEFSYAPANLVKSDIDTKAKTINFTNR